MINKSERIFSIVLALIFLCIGWWIYHDSRTIGTRTFTVKKTEWLNYNNHGIYVVFSADNTRYVVGSSFMLPKTRFLMQQEFEQGGTFTVEIGTEDPYPKIKSIVNVQR